MNMVTDRTRADVERWKVLRDKGWAKMSADEREEWLGEATPIPAAWKGMYTHNDLNRVEKAAESVAARLRATGFVVPELTVKTDWTYRDDFWKSDMSRYFENITTLRSVRVVYPTTPVAPKAGTKLTPSLANDIEKILQDIGNIQNGMEQNWCYAGEIMSGEV